MFYLFLTHNIFNFLQFFRYIYNELSLNIMQYTLLHCMHSNRSRSLQKIFHTIWRRYPAGLSRRYSYTQCVCMRIYFEWRVSAMFLTRSRNNAVTEIVAQRVWARYIIHIYPNLISVSDPPAMMAFEGPLPSRVSPLDSQPLCLLLRRIYAWTLAILLSGTHDGLHRAPERTLRAFWAEVGSGVNGDGVYWAKEKRERGGGEESEKESGNRWHGSILPRACDLSTMCGSRKPDYRFSRVFNYTLVA